MCVCVCVCARAQVCGYAYVHVIVTLPNKRQFILKFFIYDLVEFALVQKVIQILDITEKTLLILYSFLYSGINLIMDRC